MTILWIVGMGLITFLLRSAPLLLVKQTQFAEKQSRLMENLPLAVLSALTVPGIFQVDGDNQMVGITAGVVAVLLMFIPKMPLAGVIAGSVLAAVLVKIVSG